MKRFSCFLAVILQSLSCGIQSTGMESEMVRIPGGEFLMGSASGADNEKPVHAVTLKPFYLSRTEVTIGQWKKFVADTDYRSEAENGDGAHVWTGLKYEIKKDVNWKNPGFVQEDSQPVTCISWNDIQQYIQWLNRKTGKSYRLPTEAEWEYCCRAGSALDRYTEIDSISWYKDNSNESTQPVGRKQANDFKLCDMLGNVWEWCQDWHDSYPDSSQVDPTGPVSGTNHVARGGGWLSLAEYIRSTIRVGAPPNLRAVDLGFRLAMDGSMNH